MRPTQSLSISDCVVTVTECGALLAVIELLGGFRALFGCVADFAVVATGTGD